MADAINPGAIQFAVILRLAYSAATDLIIPTMFEPEAKAVRARTKPESEAAAGAGAEEGADAPVKAKPARGRRKKAEEA